MADDPPITGVTLDVNVLAGRSLVAKDGSGFLKLGKAKTSDPYVVVWYGKQKLADTKVETKTLDPVWNQTWQWKFDGRTFKASAELTFKIYDHDRGSADDPMGEVRLPVKSLLHDRESDKWYKVENCNGCSKCVSPLPCLHGLARLRPLLPPRVPPRPFAPSPPPPWMPTALAFDSLCVCSLAIATLCRTRSLQLGGTCALAPRPQRHWRAPPQDHCHGAPCPRSEKEGRLAARRAQPGPRDRPRVGYDQRPQGDRPRLQLRGDLVPRRGGEGGVRLLCSSEVAQRRHHAHGRRARGR